MRTANCPYCDGDSFSGEVIRADAVNPENPEAYAKVRGHWFNQCLGCDGWSIHRDGVQAPLRAKKTRPKAYSQPALS